MRSRTTARFREGLRKLPPDVRRRAREAFEHFNADPFRPALKFKRVHTEAEVYSVRISLGYRALAVREGDVLLWFWIGSHAEYESLLRRL